MVQHHAESCPDDIATLTARLDERTAEGWQVLTVFWQARGAPEDDQPAALAAGGSFVIICQREMEEVLRTRESATGVTSPVDLRGPAISEGASDGLTV